jgi:hypothetical protein
MLSQSSKKPPQSQTRTKENLNLSQGKAPSLADVLRKSPLKNEQRPQSHKEREAQTLVDRIEKKEASQEAAREAETRALEDHRKTV